ncbi:MAG: SAM-dependent methyltransferase [Rhodospirillaceae bacterium]|nr:SAM-dependent methyltransferase [Rhodospirillaceae bacterium]
MTVERAPGYIHTFSPAEQRRLIDQALFLEPYHHTGIDFAGCQSILEVGCGVGAQMSLLLRRWPGARFTGVDQSETQIARARQTLARALAEGRAELHLVPGERLAFKDASFDGACVFWVFEHAPQPLPILREILRVLKPGGVLFATEVFDQALHVFPRSAAIEVYFQAFMALQTEFGGEPNIGIRMPGLLAQAGFSDIAITDVSPTLDARMTEPTARRAFLDYFQTLLLSGSGPLLERGRVKQHVIDGLRQDFARLNDDPAAVFSFGAKQVRGIKPRA